MVLSQEDTLSDKQVITANAPSTNVIDLGVMGTTGYSKAPLRRLVGGTPLLIQVTEDAQDITELTITAQASDSETFASGVENLMSVTIPASLLVAGYIARLDTLPRNTKGRYFRLQYGVTPVAVDPDPSIEIYAGFVTAVDNGYGRVK